MDDIHVEGENLRDAHGRLTMYVAVLCAAIGFTLLFCGVG